MVGDSRTPLGWHSRGFLPHFDSPERVQHVVMRAVDSLPQHVLENVTSNVVARRESVALFLDSGVGECPFRSLHHAEIIEHALLHFDSVRYRLLAWCVMPNHVHVVVQQIDGFRLGDVVRTWKMFSTKQINEARGGNGRVWAPDYFDRYIRSDDHLVDVLNYVENNPMIAGLVGSPEEWAFSSARGRRSGAVH